MGDKPARKERDTSSYKNIVFDMGNVLIGYDPERSIRVHTGDEKVIWEICCVVFCSNEWLKLDGGLISEENAIRAWLPRLSSDPVREIAKKAFRDWHLYNMLPRSGMDGVVADVKARGQGVYILSNASLRLPVCYREVMPAPELYDGVFFSAEHQCVKPQDIIYSRFFREFGLEPGECFFIDDSEDNVAGAKRMGMDGEVFRGESAEELRELLGLQSHKV